MSINHDEAAALGLQLALKAVGDSQTELARICGCTQGAVWQMINRKPHPRLSVQYVLRVSEHLQIPPHLLRPDIYPAPAPAVSLAPVEG